MNSRAGVWSGHYVHILQLRAGNVSSCPDARGLHSSPMLLPKNASPEWCWEEGCRSVQGDRRRRAKPTEKPLLCWRVCGRAGQGLACVCSPVFTKHCSRREGMAGIQPPCSLPDPKDTRANPGNLLLQLVAMAAYFRDPSRKKKKKKEENQNVLLGGKKNSRGKKYRRVMRRTSKSKKCIRSSLETGV